MHYSNGREAQAGDHVVGKDTNSNIIAGTVVGGTTGSDTCNIYVAAFYPRLATSCPTHGTAGEFDRQTFLTEFRLNLCSAKELLHAEDALKTIEAGTNQKASDERVAGWGPGPHSKS